MYDFTLFDETLVANDMEILCVLYCIINSRGKHIQKNFYQNLTFRTKAT